MVDEDRVYRDLGARIRSFRRQAKLSQLALGRLLGVTFQQVQKYESGIDRISYGRMLMLLEIFGMGLGELTGVSAGPAGNAVSTDDLRLLGCLDSVWDGRAVRGLILGLCELPRRKGPVKGDSRKISRAGSSKGSVRKDSRKITASPRKSLVRK
jgi:transcriptional regulator with XRE-family HTH domain